LFSHTTKISKMSELCHDCHQEATMNEYCADCYWDRDAEKKKKQRANPKYRYAAAFAAAKTLLGKSDEEAITIAKSKIESLTLYSEK
jgi:hypothetical protein